MSKQKKEDVTSAIAAGKAAAACCRVESIISVDERGQMVLPKELRERAGISPGSKLAVASWERNGSVCCITLIKAEELVEMVKGQLGPIIKEVL